MGLTKLSLRRPVSVIVIIAAIVVFGIGSIFGLNMQLSPDMEMPMFIVVTSYVGVSPEDIDELVSQEIEEAGGTLKGLKNIESSSSESFSMVMFQYEYGTDMDDAYMDLLEAINENKNKLPSDAGTPRIIELNMNSLPTVMISASAEGDIDLLHYVEDDVVPELERITDVAEVEISGGKETYVSVSLNPQKMAQYGISMGTVVTYINAADFNMPVGTAVQGDQSMNVSISAEYTTIEQLRAIPITTSKGTVIQLSDVADIKNNYERATSLSRYNGLDNVTISITKRQSAGDVSVANDVKEVISKLESKDAGAKFVIISDTSKDVKNSLKAVADTLILGMALSMLILFLFFGDLKGSLIVGCSMPISILITFILMKLMGFSLNVVTMGGLVIGVGMMVDNSIVVLESCFRKRDDGLSYHEAAEEGTKFVLNSIIASTTTTVAVFLPISLTKGLSGQMFGPLGFTIVFSLLASLVSAITLVPLFFSKYKPKERKDTPITRTLDRISTRYSKMLRGVLHHKKMAVLIAIILLVLSGLGATLLNMELMPSVDQGQIAFNITGRPGLELEEYDKLLQSLETLVTENPDVETYSVTADSSDSSAKVNVFLKKDRSRETWEIAQDWSIAVKEMIGFDISVSEVTGDSGMGSIGGGDTKVTLLGSNIDELKEASAMVEDIMKDTQGIIDVTSTANTSGSKVKLKIDPLKAAAVGFTPAAVAQNVNMALSGVDTIEIMNQKKLYTVTVEYPEDMYREVISLKGLVLQSPSGKQVMLSDIADFTYTDSAEQITRFNGRYSVDVTGTTLREAKFDAQDSVDKRVAACVFPGDVAAGETTQDEMMTDEFTSLLSSIVVAILLVLMIMAMQFESVRFSLMVMWCIPFSLVGSVGLMLISGTTLTMVSMMGLLMLVGTVVNNGILFVDTANQLRGEYAGRDKLAEYDTDEAGDAQAVNVISEADTQSDEVSVKQTTAEADLQSNEEPVALTMSVAGMQREDALVETGRIRLRPILMTSLTTVLAMVPMSLGIGEGTEMMQSMGVVIIGGFVASTVLTLFLIPVFYTLLDQVNSGEKKLFKGPKKEKKEKKSKKRKKKDDEIEIVDIE